MDGSQCSEVHLLLLLKEVQGLLVLGEANGEALLLAIAHFGAAEVQTAATELKRHLSIFVFLELLVGCGVGGL